MFLILTDSSEIKYKGNISSFLRVIVKIVGLAFAGLLSEATPLVYAGRSQGRRQQKFTLTRKPGQLDLSATDPRSALFCEQRKTHVFIARFPSLKKVRKRGKRVLTMVRTLARELRWSERHPNEPSLRDPSRVRAHESTDGCVSGRANSSLFLSLCVCLSESIKKKKI